MARFEAWVLRRALEHHGQRRIATARSLGITREWLYKEIAGLSGNTGTRIEPGVGSRKSLEGKENGS